MELIGVVERLQVQQASLKMRMERRSYYDPAALLSVPALTVEPGGVTAMTGADERVTDVHHRQHSASKNRDGTNGISIGFSAHYTAMRARFGAHLVDGIAGENILVRAGGMLAEDDLRDGVAIELRDGSYLSLDSIVCAEPCVEFSRYALRYTLNCSSDHTVAAALATLRHGLRGFYASYAGEPAVIHLGDRVFRH